MNDETIEDDSDPARSLLEMFAATDAGVELEGQLQDALRAFGHAMVCGQLLEWATGLAAPSVTAPVDDDAAAAAAVARGVDRNFGEAIKKFEAAVRASGSLDIPTELICRLDEARQARNALAHTWVWDGVMRAAAGEAQAVIADLDALSAEFLGLVGELFEAVFVAAIVARDIDPGTFAQAQDVLATALLAHPELAQDQTFPQGMGDIAERLADAVADGERES